jgi:hypothetical protein
MSTEDNPNQLSQILDRIDRRLRVIGELAILVVSFGFAVLVYSLCTLLGINTPRPAWIRFAGFVVFGAIFRTRL